MRFERLPYIGYLYKSVFFRKYGNKLVVYSFKSSLFFSEVSICIILDAQGVLYRRSNVRRRKERDLEENDFYDSDEDTFFDRTGQIEKSRENRRKRALVRRLSKN